MDKIICFQTYSDINQAEIARAKLASAGIPCFITNTHFNTLYAGASQLTGGVQLHIFQRDALEVEQMFAELKNLDQAAKEVDLVKEICAKCGQPFFTISQPDQLLVKAFPNK